MCLLSLNPCSLGRYSPTSKPFGKGIQRVGGLNPCSLGRYSPTSPAVKASVRQETRLNPCSLGRYSPTYRRNENLAPFAVLILVLLDDTHRLAEKVGAKGYGLNPCSLGRYSPTFLAFLRLDADVGKVLILVLLDDTHRRLHAPDRLRM